jgi:hypothetical protein
MRSKTTPPPLPAQAKRPPPTSTVPPQAKGPPPTSTVPPQNRSRFRVAIKMSALDPTRLVVRRVADGVALPPGTSEGWLETSESTTLHAAQMNGKSAR